MSLICIEINFNFSYSFDTEFFCSDLLLSLNFWEFYSAIKANKNDKLLNILQYYS